MCGIAGYRIHVGEAARWATDLPRATTSLAYRGPDDGGLWFGDDDRIGLGHRRLSILDLSEMGHQPMKSPCGNWHMVFNGEVYNFRQIRTELEGLGLTFAGSGDSEVILAAFAHWGLDAVARFIGMFAIALWHAPMNRLYLIRDRLGVKPLYYRWDGNVLCFGSELKALRAFSSWRPEINSEAVTDFLRYGYIVEPRSIYRDVYKLPPAHYLTLDQAGQLELTRYWNAGDQAGKRANRAETELVDELEALMIDAFKYRMISDVPVGVFLSGGIDSSVLAAVLQKHGNQQIKTYTIGFDIPAFDESTFAAEVAKHLNTDHHSRTLRVEDTKKVLPRWADLYDEPFGDASGIPTFMVSQVAAEEVKVVLSADGGDELFSGYTSYASSLRTWNRIKSKPQSIRNFTANVINSIGIQSLNEHLIRKEGEKKQGLFNKTISKLSNIGKFFSAEGIEQIFDDGLAHFSHAEICALTGRDLITRSLAGSYPGGDGEKLCLWDLHNYLPADILTKVDRATMAVSIEGREPLLDHRLVEFAFSLPFEMRQGALGPKHLLKKVLYRYVPRPLVDRPKRGFDVPVRDWLANDLRGLVEEYLSEERIAAQGIFNPATVGEYVRRLAAGDSAVRQRVWLLLAFQMWHRRWMEPPQ